jgi:hypothetical protein
MAKLKAKQRKRLPATAFAYPSSRKYPIHDRAHARAALSRAASSKTSGSYAHVAAAVNRRYPGMAKGKTKTKAKRTTTRRRASGRKR